MSPCPMESGPLSLDSFTPKTIIKQPFNLTAQCHKNYFPVFALKVMHGVTVILLTWICKLLTRVAILSGVGHVPQVPQ